MTKRRALLWGIVVTPVLGWSVACLLPGCSEEDAPTEAVVRGLDDSGLPPTLDVARETGLTEPTSTGATADTGERVLEACGDPDAAPSLELVNVPDEVTFDHTGGACGSHGGLPVTLRTTGMAGPELWIDVTLVVGEDPPVVYTVHDVTTCDGDRREGGFFLDLPVSADRMDVELRVTVHDGFGHDADATRRFRARVKD